MPIEVGASVPWMLTPRRVQPHPARPERVAGTGRHGFQPIAHALYVGGYHHSDFLSGQDFADYDWVGASR